MLPAESPDIPRIEHGLRRLLTATSTRASKAVTLCHGHVALSRPLSRLAAALKFRLHP